MKYYECFIKEADFGSSTSAAIEVNESGIITKMVDTSTNTTNYIWDGWGEFTFIGKTIPEINDTVMYSDEYRRAVLKVDDTPFAEIEDGMVTIFSNTEDAQYGDGSDYSHYCELLMRLGVAVLGV